MSKAKAEESIVEESIMSYLSQDEADASPKDCE